MTVIILQIVVAGLGIVSLLFKDYLSPEQRKEREEDAKREEQEAFRKAVADDDYHYVQSWLKRVYSQKGGSITIRKDRADKDGTNSTF